MKIKVTAIILGLIALFGASQAQAAVNPNLNNAYASDALPLPEANTVSNQVTYVIARGYGMCVLYGARTDVTWSNGPVTSVWGYAEVRSDNGWCSGGLIDTPITIETAPIMAEPSATFSYSSRLRACTAANTRNGSVSAWVFSGGGDCYPHTSRAFNSTYPQFGLYDQYSVVKVFGATFGHRPGFHVVRQPPMWGG